VNEQRVADAKLAALHEAAEYSDMITSILNTFAARGHNLRELLVALTWILANIERGFENGNVEIAATYALHSSLLSDLRESASLKQIRADDPNGGEFVIMHPKRFEEPKKVVLQ